MRVLNFRARSKSLLAWTLGTSTVLLAMVIALLLTRAFKSSSAGGGGGISISQFNSVSKSESRSTVESKLGKSLSQQDVEYPNPPAGDSCIYYYDEAGSLQGASTFRICFKNDVVDFKDGSGADFP